MMGVCDVVGTPSDADGEFAVGDVPGFDAADAAGAASAAAGAMAVGLGAGGAGRCDMASCSW